MGRLVAHPHYLPWLIFIFFTALYCSSSVGVMNSADAVQYALARALVEKGTLSVDDYRQYTAPDYATYNGHAYSNRNPGESFALVPFYLAAKGLAPLANLPYNGQRAGVDDDSKREVLTLLFSNMTAAAVLVLFYQTALLLTGSWGAALASVFPLALGTLLWRYATTFQRQTIVMACLLLAFYGLVKLTRAPERATRYLAVSGLAWGAAFLADPTVVFALALYLPALAYLLRQQGLKFWRPLGLVLGLFLGGVALSQFYYFLVFGSPFVTARSFEAGPNQWWLKDVRFVFQSPLQFSLPTVLFNSGPLPKEAIASFLWADPALRQASSAEPATRINYQGIFALSPYLWLALLGFMAFLRRFSCLGLAALGLLAANLIPMALYSQFYNPNAYDTRFALPAVLFLSLGLPFFLTEFSTGLAIARRFRLAEAAIPFALASLVSIFNGWVAVLTHYAPHQTGEHRFGFQQLKVPFFASENLGDNLSALFSNTLPNSYNVYLLPLYFALVFAGFYGSRWAYARLARALKTGRQALSPAR